MKRISCLATLLLVASTCAFADVARPDKSPARVEKPKSSIETSMTIRLVREANEAKLIIPRSQIKQLRAALDDMDSDADSTAAFTSFSRMPTIVSGMFLSLAFVSGGMWFLRSGKASTKGGKALVILAVIAGFGSAATLIYANAGPPAEARSITGKMFSQAVHYYKFGTGAVRLETKEDDGRGVEFIVPDPADKPKIGE